MKIHTLIGITACILLSGCKGKFGSYDTLHPISSSPMAGTEDFDINRYQVGNEQLTDQLYFFGFDRSSLPAEDQESLDNIANIVRAHPNLKVRIEGHTDDIGSAEYNVGLSLRRAQTVSNFLEAHGVKDDQIEIISYGKESPLMTGCDDYARSKNRRAFLSFSGSVK